MRLKRVGWCSIGKICLLVATSMSSVRGGGAKLEDLLTQKLLIPIMRRLANIDVTIVVRILNFTMSHLPICSVSKQSIDAMSSEFPLRTIWHLSAGYNSSWASRRKQWPIRADTCVMVITDKISRQSYDLADYMDIRWPPLNICELELWKHSTAACSILRHNPKS